MPARGKLLQRSNAQMRFPNPARAHQQKPGFAAGGIIAGKRFDDELRLFETSVPSASLRFALIQAGVKIFEVAMLITPGNPGALELTRGALPLATITRNGYASLHATKVHRLGAVAGATALGAFCLRHGPRICVQWA